MTSVLSAIMLLVISVICSVAEAAEVPLAELKARLSYYSHIKSFEVAFQQVKFIKSLNVHLRSKGVLTVEKPHTVFWKIVEPSPLLVRIDDKKLELTNGSGTNVEKQTMELLNLPSAMKNLNLLTTWMKLDPVELSQNYRIYKKTKENYIFEPRDLQTAMFESFEMVMEANGQLKSLTLLEKSKDSLHIEFSNPKILKGDAL